jgi:glycosyltransferase involved in cell wall biosynthesis
LFWKRPAGRNRGVRILILNDTGALIGGAEIVTLALREALRARGHDARILASDAGTSAAGGANGIANVADYRCFGSTGRLRNLNRLCNPGAALALARALRAFRPDIVHVRMFTSQLSPWILPLLRKVPTLYHATWHELTCPLGLKVLPDRRTCNEAPGAACSRNGCLPASSRIPLLAQQRLIHRWRSAFDVVVANSPYLADHLRAAGIAPVEILWNAVPETPARTRLAERPTVTCAGRLTWEKGADVLVRAFAQVLDAVPDARLLIAGAGPQEPALNRLVADLELADSVRLLGRLDATELPEAFAGAWVHAVPSIGPESFGQTAAEAMMRGCAVVATTAGGLADIVVPEETGLLVPGDDVAALAAALVRLLRSREETQAMGRRARQRAEERMGMDGWIDGFLALYRQLAEAAGAAHAG